MTEREQIRQYLTTQLASLNDVRPFADGDSLVLSGRLSSVDVVNALTFLETTFNFNMDPNDFDLARFDSVDSIVAMVEATRQGAV